MIEKIESMALDKAGEMVLDTARGLLSDHKEKKQWKKLFIDTNEFLLKEVEYGDELLNEIAEYLSSDEMTQLAQKLTKESKYDLLEKLHVELTNIMMKYEIPANEAHYYISSFIKIIFHELEKVNPDAFQCAYLGDWRKKEENTFEEVKKALSNISNTLIKMNNHEVSVYTPEQIEVALYKETINPSLNLDFFEIDDELFKEDFLDSLSEENIYVKGQCKDETILCILNELRNVKPDKLVLVVKKEEDWNKLRLANENDEGLGGKILIPWFYADQILAIPHNTNIFVFGSEEHPVGKKTIEMRKRKRGTIIKKLEKLGMDYEDAYRFVEDTHGLYLNYIL